MKQSIREWAWSRRDSLSTVDKIEKERAILALLLPMLKDKKNVAIYVAKGSEVDITNVMNSREHWSLPKVRSDEEMDMFVVQSLQDTHKGVFGIREPITKEWMDPMRLDCIVVPLVAFDEKRNRIGHGKGYYDRYLKNTKALKIGVAFSCQKVDFIQYEMYDVVLDCIICEDKIY